MTPRFVRSASPLLLAGLVTSLGLIATGCRPPAARIDPQGRQTITTVGDLDIQDATDAAGDLSASLLEAGVLGREGKPSIIAISNYVNNTSRHIDRDEVIKKIRVSLNKAGVAQTMTTVGSTGTAAGAEDTFATNEIAADAFLGNDRPNIRPDYTLSFKLMEKQAQAGRVRQTTYTFQMSLTDLKTGLAVWEDEKQITKQGARASVGW